MEKLDKNGYNETDFLRQYNADKYPRPSLTVDMVIFTVGEDPKDNYRKLSSKQLKILLIKRGGHPFLGSWALPGGFVHPNETVGNAAYRELVEETDVSSTYLEQLYTFSTPQRDPRTWVISCAHMALIDSSNLQLHAGDDASDAKWFNVSFEPAENTPDNKKADGSSIYYLSLSTEDIVLSATVEQRGNGDGSGFTILDSNGFAFDHAEIISYGLTRLKNKLEYTDIAFHLMPEKFTLTELQQVYEIILGKPLLKAAFRRKVKDLVIETGEYTENAGHRPSQLFRRHNVE